VDLGQEAFRSVELAINKGRVEDQLRLSISDLRLVPRLDLALHWFEVPLDAVYSNRERIDEVEGLGMLGQDRSEHAGDNVTKSSEVNLSQSMRAACKAWEVQPEGFV